MIATLFSVGCSSSAPESPVKEDSASREIHTDSSVVPEAPDTSAIFNSVCDSCLLELIHSTNFERSINFPEQCDFLIEDGSEQILKIRAFTSSESGARVTLGWIIIDLMNHSMKDVTNDADHPLELDFDLTKFSNFQNCWSLLPHSEYEVPDE